MNQRMGVMFNKIIFQLMILAVLLFSHCAKAEEFTYNFSTDDWQPMVFRPIGAKTGHPGEQTEEGVLITAPNEKLKKSQVGYATRFAIVGDFEVTIGYELKEIKPPKKGYGSGVMMILYKTDGERVNFSRSVKTDGTHKFSTALWKKEKGKWNPNVKRILAKDKQGHLKLVRKDSTVTFLIKDGDKKEFTEIRKIQFGSVPVTRIELLGDTGGDKQPIKVLLTDLSVSADKMMDSKAPLPQKESFWTSWIFFSIIGGIICITAGIFAWMRWNS